MGPPSRQVSIEYRYRFSLLVAIELHRGTLARVAASGYQAFPCIVFSLILSFKCSRHTTGLIEQKGRTITTYIAREARRPNLRINHSRGNEKTKRTLTPIHAASSIKETSIAVIRRRRGRNRKAKAKMDFSGRIVRGTMKGKSPSV
ncbi:hypothetical protein ALC56_06736 [Trachymyrmex septentrionalis]|uniref:Uncharacterized protein n=1 Tax=Trachymyrmex septentrionalis TaxID=34720 RepID=A0A195FET9_9HYME|nr:hypothetical protein ALC56_06736 [Trachymyrmex septentrionalis]